MTESDILEPSEAFRLGGVEGGMPDYFSFAPDTAALLARLAETDPTTLACMHGSAWKSKNGTSAAGMMRERSDRLTAAAAV